MSEKDDKIARLEGDVEYWHHTGSEKDAEIERLTRELREEREAFLSRQLRDTALISSKGAQDSSAETAGYFYHVILRQKSLIAELCDALETTTDLLRGYGHYVKHGTDLIQRARSTTNTTNK